MKRPAAPKTEHAGETSRNRRAIILEPRPEIQTELPLGSLPTCQWPRQVRQALREKTTQVVNPTWGEQQEMFEEMARVGPT